MTTTSLRDRRQETTSHNKDDRKKGVWVSFQVKGFKPQPDPFLKEPRAFRMRAAASSLSSQLLEWMEVNPREQSLKGPVIKAMTETWDDYPEEFHRCNRGILLFAREISHESGADKVSILLKDKKLDGAGDGGHTLRHVLMNLVPSLGQEQAEEASETDGEPSPKSNLERYLEVEIMVGLTHPEIVRIVSARNTHKMVPEFAIQNLEGKFDGLRQALMRANRKFAERCVAFKPNEHIEGSDDFKPISFLTILQILTCMDIDNFDEDRHPVEAYKYRGSMPGLFLQREFVYRKMYPIAGDILQLYDRLRSRVPEAYNRKGRRWGTVVKEPIGTGPKEELYYFDPSGETLAPKAPSALFYPMLGAFRAALQNKEGRYEWIDGESPSSWPEDEFDDLVAKLAVKIAKAVKDKEVDFHAVGRDNSVWGNCNMLVKNHLLETGRVQPKGRRR